MTKFFLKKQRYGVKMKVNYIDYQNRKKVNKEDQILKNK